jgi:hypothetical protein
MPGSSGMTCSGRVVPAVQRPLVGDQPAGHGRVQAEPAHHLPGEPVRQRPFPQLGLQPGPLRRAPATPALGPQRFGPAVPPGPVPPAHRPFGDPQVARDLVDRVAAASRSAACGRSRSRRCCSAGVYPPRCAYRIPGHTPAASRRHDSSSTSSRWLAGRFGDCSGGGGLRSSADC